MDVAVWLRCGDFFALINSLTMRMLTFFVARISVKSSLKKRQLREREVAWHRDSESVYLVGS